jgi:RNA polymerase sigma factor (sigma-70 family)
MTPPAVSPSDGVLVHQFVTTRSPDAFAALMERHGPYILALCQRLTFHAQDAEDVFQACFLELVRHARSISRRGSVLAWLHTVAVRIARRARLRRARQDQKEAAAVKPASVSAEDITWREVRQILEEEVERLPEALRAPVLLCLFQEYTQEEAAQQLDLNPRTLRDRLQRGRAQLRDRLTRRGVTLAVLGALLSAGTSRAAVAPALQQATLQGAFALVNKAPLAGIISPAVLALTGSTSTFTGWVSLAAALAGMLLCASAAYVILVEPDAPPATGIVAAGPARPALPRPPEGPRKLYRSFRNKQFDADVFDWVGPNPQNFTRREDEGLRITLPEKDTPAQPVGVKLRFPVRGDFEIAVTLEILHIDPPRYFAAGVNLYLLVDTPQRDGLWFGKMKIIHEDLCFGAGRIVNSDKARTQIYCKSKPTEPEKGLARLRAVRQGSTFTFWTAEGEAGDFELLDTVEVSAADLKIVRFAVEPGRSTPTGVDARLVDFSLTAQEIVGLWSNHPQP